MKVKLFKCHWLWLWGDNNVTNVTSFLDNPIKNQPKVMILDTMMSEKI